MKNDSMDKIAAAGGERGQAMVELAVALVAVMVLTAGMIQLAILSQAHTRSMAVARQEAGAFAMADEYFMPMDARYVISWDTGRDNREYTRDDRPVSSTNMVAGGADILTTAGVDGSDLSALIADNPFSELAQSAREIGEFRLVRGQSTAVIPTLPVVRRLIYAADRVSVEGETFLIWTKGVY